MTLAEKQAQDAEKINQPIFSRHDSFPPRSGWLKKGFDALVKDPEVFNREDAAIVLGVGKNMAKAIRYWCTAFKLAEERLDSKTRSRSLWATNFGALLMENDGWDPYLEDVGTLWLLHWKLVKQPNTATFWDFAFNHQRHAEFTPDDLFNELTRYLKQAWPDSSFSEATLRNDISCFSRMYCREDGGRSVSEETISSPFAELNLLTRVGNSKHLAFHTGAKSNLPASIVVAACMEYAQECVVSEKSISVSKLLYGLGGPGMAFRLPESSIYAALDEFASKRKDLSLSQTAGVIQLQFTKDPLRISTEILNDYYGSQRRL